MLFSLLLLWMSCEQLRLLYECIPMAYIIEQAGGKATTGTMDILDIVPESIHQRTPIYMGSRDDIDDIMKIFKKHEQSQWIVVCQEECVAISMLIIFSLNAAVAQTQTGDLLRNNTLSCGILNTMHSLIHIVSLLFWEMLSAVWYVRFLTEYN